MQKLNGGEIFVGMAVMYVSHKSGCISYEPAFTFAVCL